MRCSVFAGTSCSAVMLHQCIRGCISLYAVHFLLNLYIYLVYSYDYIAANNHDGARCCRVCCVLVRPGTLVDLDSQQMVGALGALLKHIQENRTGIELEDSFTDVPIISLQVVSLESLMIMSKGK